MKKVLIYQHAGSANHGCEALACMTIMFFEKHANVLLASERKNEDLKYSLKNNHVEIFHAQGLKRFSLHWFLYEINRYVIKNEEILKKYLFDKKIVSLVRNCNLAVAIGGDIYCYDQGKCQWSTNYQIKNKTKKTVILFGASIEPKDLQDENFVEHLKTFDLITLRESISYNALMEKGLNVKLYPDVAFALPTEKNEKFDFSNRKIIGINVSPMVIGKECKSGVVIKNYQYLIRKILETTNYEIALIPHVVWDNSNDIEALDILYKEFQSTGRIIRIPDMSCQKLKYVISQCQALVASRTHASIAAYSTAVPTLVVGYSVKSIGIAQDLFGETEHYVISVQKMKEPYDLYEKFKWILAHKDEIHIDLQEKMPGYIAKVEDIENLINQLLN